MSAWILGVARFVELAGRALLVRSPHAVKTFKSAGPPKGNEWVGTIPQGKQCRECAESQ